MPEPSDIPVSDNFQPVPGVNYDDTPEAQPEAPSVVNEPEKTDEPEKASEPEKTDEPVEQSEPPKVERSKPKPIASLLEKKHELETQLEAERQAKLELEAKIEELSKSKPSEVIEDAKQLAEAYGLDEQIVSDLIKVARKGSELPPEIQNLIAERQAEKQQAEELKAFDTRLNSLSKTLPNEQFSDPKVREKLLELAYSTEKAPDGEPYFKKELSELYFAYIKPEIEPGKTSAESSQGTSDKTTVVDFEEIFNRDNPKDIEDMDSKTFEAYNAWVREHKETRTPIKRS